MTIINSVYTVKIIIIIIYFSLHIHEEYNKNTYADMYNIKTDIAPKVRECDTVTIFDRIIMVSNGT